MTSNINFTQPLETRLNNTLDNLQDRKWKITKDDLAGHTIDLALDKARLNTLTQFLPNENNEELNQLVAKIQKKITSAEQVIAFLTRGAEGIDPRLKRLREKVGQFNLQDPTTISKIRKSIKLLASLKRHTNDQTQIEILNIKKQLREIRIKLLQKTPEIRYCDIRDDDLLLKHHSEAPDPIDCLKAGREQASIDFMRYMHKSTKKNAVIDPFPKFYLRELIRAGHALAEWPNADLEAHQLFFDDIFSNKNKDFRSITLIPDWDPLNPIRTNPALSTSEILSRLLETKKENDLTKISALLRFCDRHLIISVDSNNLIHLFDQYSDGTGEQCPYIATFYAVDQAAPFLNNVINKAGALSPHSDNVLSAVCCTAEFDRNNERRKNIERIERINHLHVSLLPQNGSENSELPCQVPVLTLEQAVAALSDLNQYTFNSPINRDKNWQILDRIHFYLYHIHLKESPNKIDKKDLKWGTHAFHSEKLSTPEEKLRAIQRVQVEVLILLASQVWKDDYQAQAILPLILGALEKMQLDAKDLPQGQKNLAHCLFGNLYNIYLAAWEKDRTMIHPHDGIFRKDFGRNAFMDEKVRNSIPMEYKIQAFLELVKSLKDKWKI